MIAAAGFSQQQADIKAKVWKIICFFHIVTCWNNYDRNQSSTWEVSKCCCLLQYCSNCRETFTSKKDTKAHKMFCYGNGRFKCPNCGIEGDSFQHMYRTHRVCNVGSSYMLTISKYLHCEKKTLYIINLSYTVGKNSDERQENTHYGAWCYTPNE